MTIDERIQALTGSLELLTANVREQGQRIDQLAQMITAHDNRFEALLEVSAKHETRLDGIDSRLDVLSKASMTLLEETRSLQQIVESHERRLTRLEGGE
ncbi:MAG TPA: hypothetical protein VE734_00260 [Terriglobales bacterium]|jgi:chromosome segregation ATPase|nr:hypothetical protein [Terriglobales bacterium]